MSILACASVFASSAFASSDGTHAAHAAATKLLGAPQYGQVSDRVTNTAYAQGTYARMNGQTYFALVGGTSGLGSITNAIGDMTDGGVTWRKVMPKSRTGFVVVNAATNLVWLSDRLFTGAQGVQLAASGGTWQVDGAGTPQGEIFCRAAATNSAVLTFEW